MQIDFIALLVNWLLILIYYFYLSRRTRLTPDSSVHMLNAKVRERWVDIIMSKDNMEILAVQTLRNSVMAANFMASTSILLIIGTLNISEKLGQWALNWHPSGSSQAFSTELWQLKLCLLLLDFSVAFYCFSMSIRFFNHVGYIINLSNATSPDISLYKQTCAYLNRAGTYYTFGTRTFFLVFRSYCGFSAPIS